MKHFALVVGLIALMPLLMGAGGGNPGVPGDFKIAGTTFHADVVMDPHEPTLCASTASSCASTAAAASTAKQATIRISHDNKTAAALFTIPALFPLTAGCDLSLTDTRFLLQPLSNWIPDPEVLTPLFAEVGITIGPTNAPIITQILNDHCTPASAGTEGILSFEALVRFLVPR